MHSYSRQPHVHEDYTEKGATCPGSASFFHLSPQFPIHPSILELFLIDDVCILKLNVVTVVSDPEALSILRNSRQPSLLGDAVLFQPS